MSVLQDLVEEWCGWMFQQGTFPNAGTDERGNDVMELNRNKRVWFLPGAWNKTGIVRNIYVPANTPVLVIVASSHITQQELQRAQGTPPYNRAPPIPNPSDADLIGRLNNILTLWQAVELTIDGARYTAPNQLQPTRTDVCWMYINPNSPYKSYAGIPGGGPQSMRTAAYAVKIDTLGPPGTSHTIKVEGHARADPNNGEDRYDLEVTYNIQVVQSLPPLPTGGGGAGYTPTPPA